MEPSRFRIRPSALSFNTITNNIATYDQVHASSGGGGGVSMHSFTASTTLAGNVFSGNRLYYNTNGLPDSSGASPPTWLNANEIGVRGTSWTDGTCFWMSPGWTSSGTLAAPLDAHLQPLSADLMPVHRPATNHLNWYTARSSMGNLNPSAFPNGIPCPSTDQVGTGRPPAACYVGAIQGS